MPNSLRYVEIHFYDANNVEISNINAVWLVTILPGNEKYFNVEQDHNKLYITAKFEKAIIGTQLKIELLDDKAQYSNEIYVKVRDIL